MLCIDLIDVSNYANSNYQYNWIVTIVDVFSGRVWLGKSLTKDSYKIRDVFESKTKNLPVKHLICDNGLEFQSEFLEYCKEKGIKVRNSMTYSPTGNAIAEMKNRLVRQKMKAIFIKNKRFNWTSHLKQIEDNINSSFNSSKHATPMQLYEKQDIKLFKSNEQKNETKKLNLENNKLNKGDYVRIKMKVLYSSVRNKLKSKLKAKEIVVIWSPSVFVIDKRVMPRDKNHYIYYCSSTVTGERVNKYIEIKDLMKVNKSDVSNITTKEALRLNGCDFIPKHDNLKNSLS